MPAVAPIGAGVGRGSAALPMRPPIGSVGNQSSVPYGPTNGYATPNGVTGFIGPAAGSLLIPTAWYVRAAGSNNNGGSSSATTADRTGTDGSSTSGSLTFTSASAAFTVADIGKGICIRNATFCYAKIISINSATSVQLSNPPSATAGSLNWAIGGAWATPEPVLNSNVYANATCGVQSGDSVYVGAGTYRIVETVGTNFGTLWGATGTTKVNPAANFNGQANIVGDVTGQYTGDAGMVQLTAYTTNDKTAPSGTTLLNLNGKSNLAFSNIMFVGGTASVLTAATVTSQNLSFTDCALTGINVILTATCGYNMQMNWLFERCTIMSNAIVSSNILNFVLTTGNANDYNANVLFRNTLIAANTSVPALILQGQSGSLAGHGGGIVARNCFLFGGISFNVNSAFGSTIFPAGVYNSVASTANASLQASATGQLIENYNLIYSLTPRTNVNVGANSVSNGSYAPLFHFGQERIWGGLLRPFGEPMANSPLLGFGNDGAQTPYDGYNRPRPAGGGSGFPFPAVGWLERSNTAAQATSPAPPQGTHIWQNTGPWYQDFLLPVSNVSTTIGISVQRDASYSAPPGKTNPALLILANPTLGITAQTIVDSAATGQWNTLTAATFTPTGTGWVTVRIASYDGSGSSVVEFADVTVT